MDIQIVFVKWGEAYSCQYVNVLADKISILSNSTLHFVCITDNPSGLSPKIEPKPFPEFSVPLDTLIKSGGCRAKLSMFSRDLKLQNLPTIYVDLDTMVKGDVGKIASNLIEHPTLHGLPNHLVPHWRFPWLSWMTPEKCFFINSSVMSFFPENHYDIFDDFNDEMGDGQYLNRNSTETPLHMKSDERFISLHEKGKLRALPGNLAGSFQDLYLTPWLWLSDYKDRMNYVMKRRQNRVMLTFHGNNFKPNLISKLKTGDIVSAGRLTARWSYPEFSKYWQEFESHYDQASSLQ